MAQPPLLEKEGNGLALVILLALFLVATGCTVGPKYKLPASPATPNFKEPPPSNWKEAQPQDSELRGTWWEMFGDTDLNGLEDQVNVSNQNIAAAEARFRSARAAIRIARSGLFPTVTVGANSTTQRVSANRANSGALITTGPTTLYQLPLDINYEVDLWGKVRRMIEANVDAAQATAADIETIRLSMHSELAQDYFQMRGLDDEGKLYQSTIVEYEQALQLTTNQYNQGFVSQVDVAQAQTQLDTARAQYTDLGVARAQFEHAIAVITGKPPAELTIPPAKLPAQPPVIPVALPSQLLERRPDVASAERQAASANAQIGVAKAAYYPTLSLALTGGVQSSSLSNLLTWPSRFWSVGPALAETLFDGGARRGLTQEAQANYDQAVAVYRQSVLSAFQDVEDNLAALRILSEESEQQDVAIASAQHSVDLSLSRYRGGITTYLEVVTAQNALLVDQRTGVEIRTRRMVASVLLVKALGGGWNVHDLPQVK
jgi:NodT family efflux transporter outer membrane factor (OMF) lipoprotein